MSALVSILIPAYNSEKWIGETIASAVGQTWPRKEIIIVNDGSSDRTLEFAKRFESASLKVISQENRGASAARNRALENAQGDYIQWLDADDLLASDKISEQMKFAESGRKSLTLLSSAHGSIYWCVERARFVPNSLWHDLTPVEYFIRRFSENIWMNPAVWLVSRRITEKSGPWNEELSLNDDGEYFCRVVAASEKVKFIHEAKSYYRVGNIGSLNERTSSQACESLFLSLSLSIHFLLSLEDSERTRIACLNYLQTWLSYFYPEKDELLKRMNELASQLGGGLVPPEVDRKYHVLKTVFGWKAAKKVMSQWRKVKLMTLRNSDRLRYHLASLTPHFRRTLNTDRKR
jgi:glycosyltransferase involved in cell wall biosynthesis